MDPITLGLLIGAGGGLLKGELVDKPATKAARQREAEIAKHSAWTGMTPQRVNPYNAFNPMLQGGMTGAMLGQNIGAAQNLKTQQQFNPYMGMQGGQ